MSEPLPHLSERFEAVWQRVNAPCPQEAPAENPADAHRVLLRELIEAESRQGRAYASLARTMSGSPRLLSLSADARSCLRQLQTEYFLMTGDSCAVAQYKNEVRGLNALRDLYFGEQGLMCRLEGACTLRVFASHHELFSRQRERAAARAQAVRELLLQQMR